LQSILSQSVPPDEVVICDDGSTDRTLELIEKLSSESPISVRIMRRGPRLGIVKNFEAAVIAARGDIIFLSDQDDIWHKRKIELMGEAFKKERQVGLVYCDANIIDSDGLSDGQTVFSQRPHLHEHDSWSASRLIRGIWIKGCMMAFRRDLVPLLAPFPDEWYYDHWIGLMAAASSRVACVDMPLMEYRRHLSNASDDPFAYSRIGRIARLLLAGGSQNRYEHDIVRWQKAVDRLADMLSHKLPSTCDHKRSTVLVQAMRERLQFARTRYHLHTKPRLARIPRIFQHTANGHYHRLMGGWGSVFRDLLYI